MCIGNSYIEKKLFSVSSVWNIVVTIVFHIYMLFSLMIEEYVYDL